jgi:hypothetical protein
MHDRIISFFIDVSVPSQESERSCIGVLGISSQESERTCICVLGVSVLSHCTILILDFGTVLTWYSMLFILLLICVPWRIALHILYR